MGTWGTALNSDDLAVDLRGDFRDLMPEGLLAEAALERLMTDYASSLPDPDEGPVFLLAIADTAWKLGRPVSRATTEALRVIEAASDLLRWRDPRDMDKRRAVLERLAEALWSSARSRRGLIQD